MDTKTYRELLRRACLQSRRAGEADDLLHDALLIAIESDRGDMTRGENRRWLGGVLRNRALFAARCAARRQQRDGAFMLAQDGAAELAPETDFEHFTVTLPDALRTTALLVLTGHSKTEIVWLLRLSDAAYRKRISEIRRRWRGSGFSMPLSSTGPRGHLAFGLLRRALVSRVRDVDVALASHDPDGHLFAISSQNGHARQRGVSVD